MSPKKKTSNTILYYLNRPLGAADGILRLTVTEKNNNRTMTNGCCCWAVPLTLSNLEREIASTFSLRKISVLEVLIQTSSSGAAAEAAASEDDWKKIGASLQRYGSSIRTAHFLSCSDRDRSLILKHWVMSGHCSSSSNPKCHTTNNLNSVHIRDSPKESSYERTFRILASSSSSSTSGALSLRELVLCRGPGITDSEAFHLWTIFGRLDRFVLRETTFVNDATWWRFFEWAENHSAAAITWDEPTGTATVNAAAAAAAAASNHNSNPNPNSSNPQQQQLQQQPLQDYIDWNCRLHSWRLHWLERWRVAQRIQRPSRSAAASSSTDNDGSDNDVTEIVQAACTVLKEWYRTTHRPPVGQQDNKQIPEKEKSSTCRSATTAPASDGGVEGTPVSSLSASSSCVVRQAVTQASSSLL